MRVFIQAKKPDSSTSAALSHPPVQSARKRAEHEDKNLDARTQPENPPHFGHNFSRISLFPPTEASGESIAGLHSSRPDDSSEPGHTGHPLPNPFRQRMESSFRQDFSSVRIHEGPQAASIGAIAYTRGTDIHFASGAYQPENVIGQAVLGHELTHVVQQRTGQVPFVPTNALHINDDPALESEADTLGAQAAQGHQVDVGNTYAATAGDLLFPPAPIQMMKPKDLFNLLKKLRRKKKASSTPESAQQAEETLTEPENPPPSEFQPIGLPPLFTSFEQSFPKAAELLFDNPPAFELIFGAQRAGAEFGGYSDVVPQGETRSADERAYTIGNKVYLPKSQTDRVIYMADFLFELNNAIRKPQYEELETKARNGTIQKPDFIRGVAELELQGALKLGAIWSEVKQVHGSQLGNADQYDNEFYLADYQSIESGKDRNELIEEILQRTYGEGTFKGKTFEQRYSEVFDNT
jgi:hypothetical protein